MADLIIEDVVVGEGREVKSGDTVVMHYTGTFEDGKKFDSSHDRNQPFSTQIGVGRVIEGWDKGVPGMKVGGKRKLVIPSDMGYGPMGIPGAIPGGATLIFEVELLEVS
jgi:FKBP-type peptidyl-prolyl cis-trans isomerase